MFQKAALLPFSGAGNEPKWWTPQNELFSVLGKVTCSSYRPGVAQRVGRVIDLLFHDRGTRRG